MCQVERLVMFNSKMAGNRVNQNAMKIEKTVTIILYFLFGLSVKNKRHLMTFRKLTERIVPHLIVSDGALVIVKCKRKMLYELKHFLTVFKLSEIVLVSGALAASLKININIKCKHNAKLKGR